MTRGLFGIIKLFLFIIFLPILLAVIMAFQKELMTLVENGVSFWWGVVGYVIFHLFIFTPQALYRFWQSVFMEVCAFSGAAVNAIVVAVPIIPTILLIIYFLAMIFFDKNWNPELVIFVTGFSLAMHVILSAQELYESDDSKLKGHYLMNISLSFIINIVLIVVLFGLVFDRFAFIPFGKNAFRTGTQMYTTLLNQAGISFELFEF
jgi:hypothetical protein